MNKKPSGTYKKRHKKHSLKTITSQVRDCNLQRQVLKQIKRSIRYYKQVTSTVHKTMAARENHNNNYIKNSN